MANEKGDKYYIQKIVSDLQFIINNIGGKSLKEFEGNELLIDSMLFRLIQIAENNEKLSEKFRNDNKNIPWKDIKGMRNKIVHDYGIIDLGLVYLTLTKSVPELLNHLKKFI